MKLHLLLLCILFLPILAISQTDSLSFNLTVQKDSVLNFSKENVEFFNYLKNQVNTKYESGFFSNEKVIVRFSFLADGNLDLMIIDISQTDLGRELENALKKIKKISLPKEFDESQIELILTVNRWKENGDFEVKGKLTNKVD